MFAMILELIPFFDLISLTSFKNRDACLKQSSFKICPKCVFVRKVNPFLKRNLYIYLTFALILFSFLSGACSNNFIKIEVVEIGFNNFLFNSMKLINLFSIL